MCAPTQGRERSAGVDAVRVLGVIAVIAGHVWASGPIPHWVYPWHVPVFFVITGYLWSDRRSLAAEAHRRFTTLGRPYLAWLVMLIAAVAAAAWLRGGASPGPAITGALWGGAHATRPFTTFWFVSGLLFTVLLCKVVRRFPAPAQAVAAVAGLGGGYLAGQWLAGTPLALGMALPCLFFVLAGIAFQTVRPHIRRPMLLAVALLAAGFGGIGAGWIEPMNLKGGDLGPVGVGAIAAVAISIGLILAAEAASAALPPVIGSAATTLASSAIVVVLVHPALLWLLRTPAQGGWIDCAIVVVGSFAFAAVVARTPLAGLLTGRDPRTADARPAVVERSNG
jgi:fucose 4-O-acetylase-like acetyltransferase